MNWLKVMLWLRLATLAAYVTLIFTRSAPLWDVVLGFIAALALASLAEVRLRIRVRQQLSGRLSVAMAEIAAEQEQAELARLLLEYMRAQVDWDLPAPGRWVMSPEWRDEVRKLANEDGSPVWTVFGGLPAVVLRQGATRVMGRVVTGPEHGTPELAPLLPPPFQVVYPLPREAR